MNKLYLLFSLSILSLTGYSQTFTINDLVGLTHCNPDRFDNYVAKKGLKSQVQSSGNDGFTYALFDKKQKEPKPEYFVSKIESQQASLISFYTTSEVEYNHLCAELKKEGFTQTAGNTKAPLMYQKGNLSLQPVAKQEEGQKVWGFLIENKLLPKAKDLRYAEDLLQLTSHEQLAAVYGADNVKKDIFYFSEKEVNKCSVLYPNTNMQVIFIWNDEVNSRDISFLLIGGHLRAQSSRTYHKQIELNTWQSAQRIRSGMSLKELEQLNGAPLNLYGWDSDQPGVLINKNNGNLDFKNVTLVFDCFDCNEDKFYTKNNIISSTDLSRENRRVFISTIIVLPANQ